MEKLQRDISRNTPDLSDQCRQLLDELQSKDKLIEELKVIKVPVVQKMFFLLLSPRVFLWIETAIAFWL